MEGFTPLTFQIRDENVTRYILMLSRYFGYKEFDMDGEPNPESKGAYAKRKIDNTLKNIVEQEERKEAEGEIVIPPIEIIPE